MSEILATLESPVTWLLMIISMVMGLVANIYIEPFLKRHLTLVTFLVVFIIACCVTYFNFIAHHEYFSPREDIYWMSRIALPYTFAGMTFIGFFVAPVALIAITAIIWIGSRLFLSSVPEMQWGAHLYISGISMIVAMAIMKFKPDWFWLENHFNKSNSDS